MMMLCCDKGVSGAKRRKEGVDGCARLGGRKRRGC